ncbi:MAG: leucyl-tRNA synthetase [Planctomycetota bacterium]
MVPGIWFTMLAAPKLIQKRSKRSMTAVKNSYEPREIENRWQAFWADSQTFRASNPGDEDFDPEQPKYYVLDMFPYPSGAGLHVGHPMGYFGSDVVARKKRMEGFNVLHPIGYDAFGLPAEQYAITTGQHPAETTRQNIETYRRQLKMLGLSFDWEREFSTSDVDYYRWTQWIFARLYDKGLAYQTEAAVWWCEDLKTVLANEEVIGGRSERGDFPCERRPLKQWMLKITAYADRLIDDLELVDWPESVKTMQREWIGRSEGAEVSFKVDGVSDANIEIYTTRPDTLYGATFMVLAPEHPLVSLLTSDEHRSDLDAYIAAAAVKTDLERTDLAKGKSGVFTGAYALNPVLPADDPRARIPIWVADYVLISYGSGAIMAVPGQDQRDWEFAKQYDLPIIRTVQPPADFDGEAYSGDGPAIASEFLDGLNIAEAKARMIAHLDEQGLGKAKTNYRLRDWLFSRQRYWGEPFPLLHAEDGTITRVRDEDLPVELPKMEDFTPSEDGSAPLARATDWVSVTDPATGQPAMRETDTMPGWAGSCWYYLRYMDPHNDHAAFDAEVEKYWGSVDLYIGGVEHAVLHLLYARFWHKVLYDLDIVSTKEPFTKYFNQGMITAFSFRDSTGRLVPSDEVELVDGKGESVPTAEAVAGGDHIARMKDGTGELDIVIAKMSKSLRNVVNPDDVANEYGVDAFRLYELFMGPLSDSKPWNPRDVPGCKRFLDRVWRMIVDPDGREPVRTDLAGDDVKLAGASLELEKSLHRMVKRINDSFTVFNFNTAVSGMMTFVNDASKRSGAMTRSQAERFVCALSPFAPHIAEELWQRLGHEDSIARAAWPEVVESYLVDKEVEIVVQIMGKTRARVTVATDTDKDAMAEVAREAVADQLEGKQILKTIVVPGKLVNFVAK